MQLIEADRSLIAVKGTGMRSAGSRCGEGWRECEAGGCFLRTGKGERGKDRERVSSADVEREVNEAFF
jgi:hypothetical protein